MALSRPWHYFAFAATLAFLFIVVFQTTQAVHDAPPQEVEPLPVLIETEERIDVPIPTVLADLLIRSMGVRECVSSDPEEPGGLLTVTLANEGEAAATGFLLFIALDVFNERTGVSILDEHEAWIEDLPAGAETTVEIPYSFPQEDTLAGPVVAAQPVPGEYRLEALLDRPSLMPGLGDEGVLAESDEQNNSARTHTSGSADGVC